LCDVGEPDGQQPARVTILVSDYDDAIAFCGHQIGSVIGPARPAASLPA
jgi:hypothetical protein